MSHRDDNPAFPNPGGSPHCCGRCKRDGEDCRCVAPGQIEFDTVDYRDYRSLNGAGWLQMKAEQRRLHFFAAALQAIAERENEPGAALIARNVLASVKREAA